MDSSEHSIFEEHDALAENTGPAYVLIAASDSPMRNEWISRIQAIGHTCVTTDDYDATRKALSHHEFDAVLIDRDFDNDSAIRLARLLNRFHLNTKAVLITPELSSELLIDAMRHGVVDVISLPADNEQFEYSLECAIMKAREDKGRDRKLLHLRDMCKKLNAAKMESSRQVDILCKDLANAYEDIADQMTEVAIASEFKTLLAQELDLESLLRTSLEYILTKTGPTNAAVLLPDTDRDYSLGAYVNYNCPRETADVLLDHLCTVVCPHMENETEIIMFDDADELASWLGTDADFLSNSQVIAFSCMHQGECLAIMVLFRDKSMPYGEDVASAIDILRPIFAKQVSSVINVHHRAKPQWPEEAAEDAWDEDDCGFGFAA